MEKWYQPEVLSRMTRELAPYSFRVRFPLSLTLYSLLSFQFGEEQTSYHLRGTAVRINEGRTSIISMLFPMLPGAVLGAFIGAKPVPVILKIHYQCSKIQEIHQSYNSIIAIFSIPCLVVSSGEKTAEGLGRLFGTVLESCKVALFCHTLSLQMSLPSCLPLLMHTILKVRLHYTWST